MKRILLTLALLFGLALPASAADIILSFRNTAGFVTDATGTYVLGSDTYPTSRGGFTFGWLTAGCTEGINRDSADRDSAVTDKRLAGIHYVPVTTQCVFQVDLPATGAYDIRLANGDTGFDQSGNREYFEVFDNTTSKLVIDKLTGPAQDHYYDATGVDRTEAAWPGSNAASTQTFASTTFKLQVGSTNVGGVGAGTTVLAHLQITTSAGGGVPVRHRVINQ